MINIARDKGVSAYIGDGANRWPAVHRLDAAHLFRLAVEAAPAGSRLDGVADEGFSPDRSATCCEYYIPEHYAIAFTIGVQTGE